MAAETPESSSDFFALMALLGLYVGVIPVALGMLWLPFVRRISESWIRLLIAFTVGLLAVLGVDAGLEGLEIGAAAPSAFGGQALVLLGALGAYLALAGVDSYLSARAARSESAGPANRPRAAAPGSVTKGGAYLALLVAIGIGLHNLGEGLAIGSAYAVGALALGTFLVIGFALHNTTEGLAIVAPLAEGTPGLGRLGCARPDRGRPGDPGRVDRLRRLQPERRGAALRRRRGSDRQGRVAARPGDARRSRTRAPPRRRRGARRRDAGAVRDRAPGAGLMAATATGTRAFGTVPPPPTRRRSRTTRRRSTRLPVARSGP